MKVKVRLFADLRDYLPPGSDRFSCEIEILNGDLVENVLNKLNIPDDLPKIILLNGVYSNREASLKDGDVISVFPPIAGG